MSKSDQDEPGKEDDSDKSTAELLRGLLKRMDKMEEKQTKACSSSPKRSDKSNPSSSSYHCDTRSRSRSRSPPLLHRRQHARDRMVRADRDRKYREASVDSSRHSRSSWRSEMSSVQSLPSNMSGNFFMNHALSDVSECDYAEDQDSAGDQNMNVDPDPDQVEDEDNLLADRVKQLSVDTQTGSGIKDGWLRTFVDKSMTSPKKLEGLKTALEKYLRPENVESLQIPQVDKSVWMLMNGRSKHLDLNKQRSQNVLIKMMIAIVRSLEKINSKFLDGRRRYGKDNNPLAWLSGCISNLGDAVEFGSFLNSEELTKRRRFDLRQHFPEKYRVICNDTVEFPSTPTFLLGDKIATAITQVDLAHKLRGKLTERPSAAAGFDPKRRSEPKGHQQPDMQASFARGYRARSRGGRRFNTRRGFRGPGRPHPDKK